MTLQQHKDWTLFRARKSNMITQEEFEMLCHLHADLFNHQFYKPCTCRPKEINQWISQINKVYEGLKPDTDD